MFSTVARNGDSGRVGVAGKAIPRKGMMYLSRAAFFRRRREREGRQNFRFVLWRWRGLIDSTVSLSRRSTNSKDCDPTAR